MSYTQEGVDGIVWRPPVKTPRDLIHHEADDVGSARIVLDLLITYVRTETAWLPLCTADEAPLGPPIYFSAIDKLAALIEQGE